MASDPSGNRKPSQEAIETLSSSFAGQLCDVTDARLTAESYLSALARASPPSAAEHWDDILLVVTELVANSVQYAPGPFELRMRRTFDGVHVTVRDSSTTPPAPRPCLPLHGGGGIGWHLIHTLCDQVSVVLRPDGKDVHTFLPW
ncbi:ATP-binding protein [Streptomyces sp. NBC_00620]|uniref:ATP-binding protein n=1 Tax=unclassified Streptomyces TaxID=2593676 RepID=UPI0022531ACC|nr:ATP-binding protein [Streptomyces sp. NBC_00620]MCX4976720.1 ATP-binding protein [Streptomyces sp. NBC_00620]WUC09301.1 ATP-binding protein [Streptomyces sp. NBC_00564]WUC54377.1 ATP-binding protein [Streptomyces sp. NBC_00554]